MHNLHRIFLTPFDPSVKLGPVLGGPCVCFAKGDPQRLTLQDLVDTFIPVYLAHIFGVPVYIYFQSWESILMHPVHGFDPSKADFESMKRILSLGVRMLLAAKDIEMRQEINWLDTGAPDLKATIDEFVDNQHIADNSLFGLYDIDGNSGYPRGKPEAELMLNVYRRNISVYSFQFLIKHTCVSGKNPYVIAENEHQKNAVAFALASFGKGLGRSLIYRFAVNRQGKEMCCGNRNHKLELRSSARQLRERGEPLASLEYYQALFSPNRPDQIMAQWKELIK